MALRSSLEERGWGSRDRDDDDEVVENLFGEEDEEEREKDCGGGEGSTRGADGADWCDVNDLYDPEVDG